MLLFSCPKIYHTSLYVCIFFSSLEVTPGDPYILEGQDLVLNCSLKPDVYDGPLNASYLFFKQAKEKIDEKLVTIINPYTIQLKVPKVSLNSTQTGRINCYLQEPGGEKYVGAQFIHIASKYYKRKIYFST